MSTELKTLVSKISKMQDEIKNKFSNSEKH